MLCDLSEQSNTRNILHNLDLAYVIGKFKWEHSFELYLIKNRLAGSFFHAKPRNLVVIQIPSKIRIQSSWVTILDN